MVSSIINRKQLRKSTQLVIRLLFISLYFIPFIAINNVFAEVSASTDRSVLSIDESINLEIQLNNASGTPNLSVLDDDFTILKQSQSQNYSLINGHASRTHTWSITLLPKHVGELTIPAISVGDDKTQPIHLVIQKQSQTPGADGKEVYLNIKLSGNPITDKTHYYVQQQIIVTVQLFHRIRFTNGGLSELKIDNTVIEPLQQNVSYSKTIGKHRYNVIENSYAIYPQQSGQLTIPAINFSGNAEISQSFSLFSRPGKQIISRTKPISLTILPIPDNYTGASWLPAESLELEANILEDAKTIIAGEAITRHIVIRAKGLLGSQLPAISIPASKQIKTYPDKEKLSNQLLNGEVLGIRRDTIAIIPLKAGEFTLPEIKIDWWNTKTNQQQSSIIAAQTLLAQPSSEPTSAKQATLKSALSEQQIKGNTKTSLPIEKIVYKTPEVTKNLWFWISIALTILWLLTLALLLTRTKNKQRSTSKAKKEAKNNQHISRELLENVYTACRRNDAHACNLALIEWGSAYFNTEQISNLATLIDSISHERANDHLGDLIHSLEKSLYSKDKGHWQGKQLSTALEKHLEQLKTKKKQKQQPPQALSPLNP